MVEVLQRWKSDLFFSFHSLSYVYILYINIGNGGPQKVCYIGTAPSSSKFYPRMAQKRSVTLEWFLSPLLFVSLGWRPKGLLRWNCKKLPTKITPFTQLTNIAKIAPQINRPHGQEKAKQLAKQSLYTKQKKEGSPKNNKSHRQTK